MITDLDTFYSDRFQALNSLDLTKIKAFAKEYLIKLPSSDEEILKLAKAELDKFSKDC